MTDNRPLVAQLVQSLNDPVILLDGNGRVAEANALAHERFGAWIDGQSYVSVLRQPNLLAPVEAAFARRAEGTARFTQSSGAIETLFDVRISPLDDGGARPLVLLVFRDVTGARDEQSMRSDFVANVSHELKTPLTAVMGFIETLQGPARDDARARERFLGLMAQETGRMNRLVSDLLALSRLEGLTRRRPTDPVDLVPLLAQIIEALQPGAAGAEVSLKLTAPQTAMVPGDRDQLVQVVTNLVENAVKYGAQPGTVRIILTDIPREPVLRGPAWQLRVTDDGPGIPHEHLPRLTERFYRVDTGRSREQGGTGLGLAIVKHIVNRHRGRLRIVSREGHGTTVSVTLPAL